MKVTDFKFETRRLHKGHGISYAAVNVTTGYFWWKRTTSRVIMRHDYSDRWYFCDSGALCPRIKGLHPDVAASYNLLY